MRPPAVLMISVASAVLGGCSLLRDEPSGDEILDETPWQEVTPQNGVWDGEYGRTSDPSDCSFAFRLLRRADGIVVEARVRDNRVVTDSSPIGSLDCPSWDDDTFQCFFDGDNDRAPDVRAVTPVRGGEYTLVANGASQSEFSSCPKGFGRAWKGTVGTVQQGPGAYELNYSLWFSWEAVGFIAPPDETADVTFGFNACVHDDDTGGRADRALYWKGTPVMPYRDESRFEKITLKGRNIQ